MLTRLPPDVLAERILARLPALDVLRIERTCRQLNRVVHDWNREYARFECKEIRILHEGSSLEIRIRKPDSKDIIFHVTDRRVAISPPSLPAAPSSPTKSPSASSADETSNAPAPPQLLEWIENGVSFRANIWHEPGFMSTKTWHWWSVWPAANGIADIQFVFHYLLDKVLRKVAPRAAYLFGITNSDLLTFNSVVRIHRSPIEICELNASTYLREDFRCIADIISVSKDEQKSGKKRRRVRKLLRHVVGKLARVHMSERKMRSPPRKLHDVPKEDAVLELLRGERMSTFRIEDNATEAFTKEFFLAPQVIGLATLNLDVESDRRSPSILLFQTFDDECLMERRSFQHLKVPRSRVTFAGLNTFLQEFYWEKRSFQSLIIGVRSNGESAERANALLTDKISWPANEKRRTRHGRHCIHAVDLTLEDDYWLVSIWTEAATLIPCYA